MNDTGSDMFTDFQMVWPTMVDTKTFCHAHKIYVKSANNHLWSLWYFGEITVSTEKLNPFSLSNILSCVISRCAKICIYQFKNYSEILSSQSTHTYGCIVNKDLFKLTISCFGDSIYCCHRAYLWTESTLFLVLLFTVRHSSSECDRLKVLLSVFLCGLHCHGYYRE